MASSLLLLGARPGRSAVTAPVTVSNIAANPVTSVGRLIATGDTLYSFDGYSLQVSRDLGRTWSLRTTPPGLWYGVLAASGDSVHLAWIDSTSSDLRYSASTDGGTTWGPSRQLVTGSSFWLLQVAASPDGSVAIAQGDGVATQVSVSTDGGASFTPWRGLGSGPSYGAQIAWTGANDLLVCALQGEYMDRYTCWVSHDRGASFSPATTVEGNVAAVAAEMVVRAPGDVLLAYLSYDPLTYNVSLRARRSSDGGATWSAPTVLVASTVGGQILAAADPAGQVWLGVGGQPAVVFKSLDGATWSQVGNGIGCSAQILSLAAPRPDFLVGSGYDYGLGGGVGNSPETLLVTWHSTDGGRSFTPLAVVGSTHAGYPSLVRTDRGRLVAAWLEGPGGQGIVVRTSHSDDEGATWSSAATLSDRPLVPSSPLDLIATPGGGVAAAWLSSAAGGCGEVRLSRSPEGATFEASFAVAEATRPEALYLGADGAGNLALLWRDGTTYVTASSADTGATWSPAVGMGRFIETSWEPSEIVRAADGSLSFAAVIGDPACRWCSTLSYRTEDGGLTWTPSVLEFRTGPPFSVEVAAGGRHLTVQTPSYNCGPEGCEPLTKLYRSDDNGLTWKKTDGPELFVALGRRLIGGDELGNVYYRDAGGFGGPPGGGSGVDLIVLSRDGREHRLAGVLPTDLRALTAVVRAPGDLAVLSDRWAYLAPPSEPFDRVVSWRLGEGLVRNDSIRSLDSRPDLRAIFPLAAYRSFGAAPNMTDPDESALDDAARPLIFYGLGEVADNRLFLTKSEGRRVRLTW